jgi:hypothetical protein
MQAEELQLITKDHIKESHLRRISRAKYTNRKCSERAEAQLSVIENQSISICRCGSLKSSPISLHFRTFSAIMEHGSIQKAAKPYYE